MVDLHVHNEDDALFVGKEQEGPHQGDLTLFVKGAPPEEVILSYFHAYRCRRLYFGAGRLSAFDINTVNTCVSIKHQVTVEVPAGFDLTQLPDAKNLTVHYTVHMPGVVSVDNIPKVTMSKATLVFKVDVGTACFFFTSNVGSNRFDGYPDDRLLYLKVN